MNSLVRRGRSFVDDDAAILHHLDDVVDGDFDVGDETEGTGAEFFWRRCSVVRSLT